MAVTPTFSRLKFLNRAIRFVKNSYLLGNDVRYIGKSYTDRSVVTMGRNKNLTHVTYSIRLKCFGTKTMQIQPNLNEFEVFSTKWFNENAKKTLSEYFVTLLAKKSISESDWEKITEFVLTMDKGLPVNKQNVGTFIMKYISQYNDLNFARSYYKYLENKNGYVNIITLSWYVRLCYFNWTDHIKSDSILIDSFCNEILKTLPAIEFRIGGSLIMGLCLTDRWKESFKVIDSIKNYTYVPDSYFYPVITAAFNNRELETGWQLMENLTERGVYEETIYNAWLSVNEDKKAGLSKLLHLFSKYNVVPKIEFNENLLRLIKHGENIDGVKPALTEVSHSGICKNCKKQLQQEMLTKNEFEKLRSSFLDSLIVGKDIFRKSNPGELTKFQEFLNKTAPYDFVLDGLNIAYCASPKKNSPEAYSEKLKTVVKYLKEKNKKVLVFGRSHMNRWPKKYIDYIKKNANLFLIEDVSADDPYLLYAALYSGMNTCFISRDLMRGHKYLLGKFNHELYSLFWRWQCLHQHMLVYILDNGNVILRPPVYHVQKAHQLSGKFGRWHVPCMLTNEPNTPGHKKFTLKTWLCLPPL